MQSVRVYAASLRAGDVLKGRRIAAVHKHPRRSRAKATHKLATTGVLVVAPSPNGYKLDTFQFAGNEKIVVKRPKYNMRHRRKPKPSTPIPTKPEPLKVGDIVSSTINKGLLWRVMNTLPNGNLDVRPCTSIGNTFGQMYTDRKPEIFIKQK